MDVLVNNAGVQPPSSCVPCHVLPESTWHHIMAVNVTSQFYMCKQVLPIMLDESKRRADSGLNTQARHVMYVVVVMSAQDSGVIINVASVQGLQSQEARCFRKFP